jgi:hypothetical protein
MDQRLALQAPELRVAGAQLRGAAVPVEVVDEPAVIHG